MFPILMIYHWIHAAVLMQRGYWCWQAGTHWACTLNVPHFHGQGQLVGRHVMHKLIRHVQECSAFLPGRWLCVPH
jgi:hypothetical protein